MHVAKSSCCCNVVHAYVVLIDEQRGHLLRFYAASVSQGVQGGAEHTDENELMVS